jgi:hypothetical protein
VFVFEQEEKMAAKTRKATFNLHIEVLDALDAAMAKDMAPSKNALVEQALLKELKELRRRENRVAWEQAMKDPLYLKDVAEIEADFRYVDAESVGRMD